MNNEIFFDIRTDACDWNGRLLNPKIKDAVSINNFVRVCVKHDSGYAEAIYVLITAVDGSDLVGIVQDTYRQFFEGEMIYVENGESIRFPRAAVIEVPLDWEGNENLKDVIHS